MPLIPLIRDAALSLDWRLSDPVERLERPVRAAFDRGRPDVSSDGGVFYNEIDDYAVRWLRNLIDHGHIARGVVDSRSIEDIYPDELVRYRQCHFFAGIGVWSHALRLAGWPDDRPVWTGSCPCQPFSAAGKGAGFDDERHLWPAWHWLIEQCRPPVVFGEQVASKAVDPWIDLVQDDMEGLDYAFGTVAFPAASVGAPHIRDRCYWVADADGRHAGTERQQRGRQHGLEPAHGGSGALAPADGSRLVEHTQCHCAQAQPGEQAPFGDHACRCGLVGDARGGRRSRGESELGEGSSEARREGGAQADGSARPSPTDIRLADDAADGWREGCRGEARSRSGSGDDGKSFWSDADWIPCRDGKSRPVEPGTFPLAHGATARVGRLRAYGNAIVAQQAAEWIKVVMECRPC